ncbi:SAM-dependent methyltransferase [Subtercola boreus]|uniref:SAM-dependent methyltransferase n=1 Tax=Subtercola boreus TaxID=120213 RepID=A0A3E0VJI2_9MICO|nr:methyltransferase [Subtercola boreus]RFA09881.1 SAM-dependent methyltransferase [Subtercola boreus]TQL52988.1 methyltransferase family protein [Subtercola boreus]
MGSTLTADLRRDLITSSFSVETVSRLWGEEAAAALFRGHRLPALRALRKRREDGEPLTRAEALAALFVLNEPLERAEVDRALPQLGSQGAETLGLVGPTESGDLLRARLDLRPYSFVDTFGAGSWWILSDLGELALGHPLGEDHVLGIGGASTTLSGLMISKPIESALDLGTGCGIQALHASRHARRVVATDISERALWLAELNAELNAVDNIEFRLGSLFEPVLDERFDQIVSNPPFVITPRRDGVPLYEYRDGGLVGDALVQTVIQEAGDHLTPGGVAQLLGNWEYHSGAGPTVSGLDHVRSWVAPTGLDAWVIERELQDAALYAETWIRDGGTRPGTPQFDELYAAWLDDFDARGVTRVGFGYVLLRAPHTGQTGAEPLARYETLHGGRGDNPAGLGEYFQTALEGHDWQASLSDASLLTSVVTYAPDVTEERHYWPGQENPTVMTLRQGSGFARSVPLDTTLAALVGACDGDLTLGQLCGAIAHLLEVDEALLVADVLPRIRSLVDDGFLLPLR